MVAFIRGVVEDIAPGTNPGSVRADINFHCINDPSKKHSPGLRYLKNPLLITDGGGGLSIKCAIALIDDW